MEDRNKVVPASQLLQVAYSATIDIVLDRGLNGNFRQAKTQLEIQPISRRNVAIY